MIRTPALRWTDGPDGRRLLYAGNSLDPVADVERDVQGWCFTVFLPGKEFQIDRPFGSRAAVEAHVSGIVEAWFKGVYA